MLHLIVGSVRPLTLDELRILLESDQHHCTVASIERESQTNLRKTIESILGPLVRISDSRTYLVHQSLKEFLYDLSAWREHSLSSIYGVDSRNANLVIARAYIAYLQLDDFGIDIFSDTVSASENSSTTSPTAESFTSETVWDPFDLREDLIMKDPADVELETCRAGAGNYLLFDYAVLHWAEHYASSDSFAGTQASALALSESNSRRKLHWFRYYWFYAGEDLFFPYEFDEFFVACFFGHLSTLSYLLEHRGHPHENVSARGISWSSRLGHADVVACLLRIWTTPNGELLDGQTSLIAAAQFGHIQVVKLLMQVDTIEINSRGRLGRTALGAAAINGNADIVKILLDHEKIKSAIARYSRHKLKDSASSG